MTEVAKKDLEKLAMAAWTARESAYVLGPTRVGCALLSDDGQIHTGCNIEHRFRSHDVHAEVNAISSMILAGGRKIRTLVIAAKRDQFTPCGACMDWIMQFSDGECLIAFQSSPDADFTTHKANELMPFYPR